MLGGQRRTHRRNEGARDTDPRKLMKRHAARGVEFPHRFQQAEHPFLNQIVRIGAGEEIRPGTAFDQTEIAPDQKVARFPPACARCQKQFFFGLIQRLARRDFISTHHFKSYYI